MEWCAYAEVVPFGEFRADWRNAQLLAQQANLHRDTKRRWRPYEVGDFLLRFVTEVLPQRTQSWREQKAAWLSMVREHMLSGRQGGGRRPPE